MRTSHNLLAITLTIGCAAALAVGAGCGDDEANPGAGGSTSTGGSIATGGTGGQGTGGESTIELTATIRDFDGQAVEGVGVAVDLADATRVEGVTNAQGVAVLQVPEGVAVDHVISHKNGYSFNSIAGAALADQVEFELWLMPASDTSGMVTVSGTATNMSDPANDYLTVLSTTGTFFEERGVTAYELLVPPNEDFSLLAGDTELTITDQNLTRTFHSVRILDQAAITDATTVDIDFNGPLLSTTPFSTSLTLPADSVLATSGVAMINVGTAHYWAGGSVACPVVGMAFECDGEIFDVGEGATGTNYLVIDAADFGTDYGRSVQASAQGGPSVGLVDMDFPNPPDVTAPTGAGPHPVDTLVEFTVADGGGAYNAIVANITTPDGRLVGIAGMWEGQLSVPALPSTSDAASLYEDSMIFTMFTCRSGPGGYCAAVGMESWEASPPAN